MATITGACFTVEHSTGGSFAIDNTTGTATVFLVGSGNTATIQSTAANVNVYSESTGGNTIDASQATGTDQLVGGAGNDTLIASVNGATDTLIGGGGADNFDFGVGHGTHTVTDFVASQDTIQLAAQLLTNAGYPGDLAGFLTANTTDNAAGALIHLGSGDTLQVNGIDKAGILSAASSGHITAV